MPRDARLRILAVESVATLRQTVERAPGRPASLVRTVAAVVRTQLEFNDPAEGFVRREGTNEYVLRVTDALEGGDEVSS